jgi:hypothetical protein
MTMAVEQLWATAFACHLLGGKSAIIALMYSAYRPSKATRVVASVVACALTAIVLKAEVADICDLGAIGVLGSGRAMS